MNSNQKSLAVLSSPYLFGISQVGAAFAALARYPVRNFFPAILASGRHVVSGSAGQRSCLREDKYTRHTGRNVREFGDDYCGAVIPANRTNRKDRRAPAKFARRNPTIKAS